MASSLREIPGRPMQKQAQATWSEKIRLDHLGLCACVRWMRSIPADADVRKASANVIEESRQGYRRPHTACRRRQKAAGPDGDPGCERLQPNAVLPPHPLISEKNRKERSQEREQK